MLFGVYFKVVLIKAKSNGANIAFELVLGQDPPGQDLPYQDHLGQDHPMTRSPRTDSHQDKIPLVKFPPPVKIILGEDPGATFLGNIPGQHSSEQDPPE